MILLFSILIISATSFTLILANSPIILGLWILILALTTAIFLNIFITSWLGIFIFLIYVGGLLIMFSYFVALSPNQYMSLKYPLITLILSVIILAPLSSIPLKVNTIFWSTSPPAISALLSSSNIPIFCLLALALFLALVSVVKIRGGTTSPLRPYKN